MGLSVKKKLSGKSEEGSVMLERAATLYRIAREGFNETVTFESRPVEIPRVRTQKHNHSW